MLVATPRSLSASSLSVSAVYYLKYACTPASITARRFAHAVLSVFHAVLSLGLTRKNRRAFSLAFHEIVKAAEVSAVSHHPSLCVRRGGGGTAASTALKITLVKDSAISEILFGCNGISVILEMIRATAPCLQSPPDRNFCRSNGWNCFFVRMSLLGAIRPMRRTIAYTMLWSESVLDGGEGWG